MNGSPEMANDDLSGDFDSDMLTGSVFGMTEPINMSNLSRCGMTRQVPTRAQLPTHMSSGRTLFQRHMSESPMSQHDFGSGPAAQKRPRLDADYLLTSQSVDVFLPMTDGRTLSLSSIINPLLERVDQLEKELQRANDERQHEQEDLKHRIKILETQRDDTEEGGQLSRRNVTDKSVRVSENILYVRRLIPQIANETKSRMLFII
jgi:hypothetical protein